MDSSERQLSALETQALEKLRSYKATKNVIVALSGGMDSKVLLHVCWRLREKGLISQVSALHIDHGLQSYSHDWRIKCQIDCEKYKIPFDFETLNLGEEIQTNIEACARNARYQIFEKFVHEQSFLLLAHHENDQAETLLFRLIRGCGIAGAAAMPTCRRLGNGYLLRPLINVNKQQIEQYAVENQLQWIEDPSNQSESFSRNYLRHQVMPLLFKKWPSVSRSFARFAQLASEQNDLLKALAEEDAEHILTPHGEVQVEPLLRLSLVRQKNLLHQVGAKKLQYAPTHSEVSQIISQLPAALDGAQINIDFADGRVRSYLGRLIITAKSEPHAKFMPQYWEDLESPLKLDNGVKLEASVNDEPGLRLPKEDETVKVSARVGGEKLCPDYRMKSTSLKKIYQELAVPPWQREWLPIISYNDQIVAVPGVFVEKSFLSEHNEKTLNIQIKIEDTIDLVK